MKTLFTLTLALGFISSNQFSVAQSQFPDTLNTTYYNVSDDNGLFQVKMSTKSVGRSVRVSSQPGEYSALEDPNSKDYIKRNLKMHQFGTSHQWNSKTGYSISFIYFNAQKFKEQNSKLLAKMKLNAVELLAKNFENAADNYQQSLKEKVAISKIKNPKPKYIGTAYLTAVESGGNFYKRDPVAKHTLEGVEFMGCVQEDQYAAIVTLFTETKDHVFIVKLSVNKPAAKFSNEPNNYEDVISNWQSLLNFHLKWNS